MTAVSGLIIAVSWIITAVYRIITAVSGLIIAVSWIITAVYGIIR